MDRNEQKKEPLDGVEQEIASAVNLMAHPVAGMAAAGALGFGVATQMAGFWLGALAGATQASNRMLSGGLAPVEEAPKPRRAARGKPRLELVASTPREAASAKPAGIDKPAQPDDLKAIAGVGPKLEKVLNGLGIWTYGRIAALDEAEIAWLDDHLGFAGRIGRDDWIGQAARLAARA